MSESLPGDLLAQLTGREPTEAALVAVLDALPDAIITVDHEGRIRSANANAERITGYPRQALVGRIVEDLLPDERRSDHVRHRRDYRREPSARPMGAMLDIGLRRADGAVVPVDISLGPVTVQGEPFVVAAIRDATPRREVEDALRRALELEGRATEELREIGQLRDSFLRALSHDLRTPLASMLGLAMTVEEHLEELSDEAIRDLLGRLRANGARLERMLSDLLELDRASREGAGATREEIDLVGLIHRVVGELGEALPEVTVDAPAELRWPVVRAEVRRILENLLLNAAKYAGMDRPITVHLGMGSDEVVLSVHDRGPGVPDAEKGRIFEPFVRGGHGDSVGGSGVGLSLVAAFARAHGGRAWVGDRPGGGASFHVSLPRSSA